jgi:16S rRNA (cytosine967-C5)-methyltransferase
MQLAEAVGPGGRVFAIDPNARRCDMLRRTLAERSIGHVGVIEASWMKQAKAALPEQFDRVLIDAPCSNSGVLIRRPEARYAQSAGALRSLAKLQKAILSDTAPFVRSGGRLVYSTCSIWPEENERIVEWFIAGHDGWRLVDQQATLPSTSHDPSIHHDGGFAAILERD